MLKELLFPLTKYFSFFNIFQYITFRSAYAAVTALLICFIFMPRLIRHLKKRRVGQEVREDGPQTHLAKSGTPTMGGILINIALIISTLMWQDIRNPYTWIVVICIAGFGTLGFIDDYLKVFKQNAEGLHAKFKFIGQTLLATGIVTFLYLTGNPETTLLYLPFVKFPVLDLSFFYIPFGVLIIVGFSNAVNLTDGLDGLASGLLIIVGITFAFLAYLTGRADYSSYLQIPFLEGAGELTVLCFALVGSVIGFLWFNAHPAEIMMGDTGSLSLGGIIGVVALMLKKEILLIIIGGVFVLEAVSVIIQVVSYKLRKKRVFKMAPLHHHFELIGWAESKVVMRLWILGGLFAIVSLSTLKLQ